MTHQIQLPDQLKQSRQDPIYVTLVLPQDTRMPTIDGQWQRLEDGRIEAEYTREQLSWAVQAGLAIKIGEVEKRLAAGEAMIAQAQAQGDAAQIERLERHYVSLIEAITALLDAGARAAL